MWSKNSSWQVEELCCSYYEGKENVSWNDQGWWTTSINKCC